MNDDVKQQDTGGEEVQISATAQEEKQEEVGVADDITSTATTPTHIAASSSSVAQSDSNDAFTPCAQWNRDGLCPFKAQCPFLHECATCKRSTHGQFSCPETKPYRCTYCMVCMSGFSRYKIHCETEEHISRKGEAEKKSIAGADA